MTSIAAITARKELLDLARSGRLRWGAAIVWLLVAASMIMAWPEYQRRVAGRAAAHVAAREHWLEQGAKNPHTAAHFGVYAVKPVTPLTIFDPGVTTYVGTQVLLEAHWQNPLLTRPADVAPLAYRAGLLSPAAVLQVVLPLLIILLGYGVIADERARGTWGLLMAQTPAPLKVGIGKLLGQLAAVGALLLPAVSLAVAAALWLSPADATAMARGALTIAAYVGYAAAWLAVTLLVSAGAASPRRALTVLVAFWIVSTLIVPRAAAEISRAVFPTPSAFEFHEALYRQKADGLDGHNPEDARVEALRAETLKTYGVQRVEDLPINFEGLALQADETYGNAVFDRAYGEVAATFDRQARLQRLASVISPAQALRAVSAALAGTDVAHDRDFASQAETYRRRLVAAMNNDLTLHSKTGDFTYEGDRSTWASVPAFVYTPPPASWAVRQEWASFAVLALWCVVPLALSGVLLRRAMGVGRG
jgi:ABC-2 type transport system permease protein